jgi:hypothetical protein
VHDAEGRHYPLVMLSPFARAQGKLREVSRRPSRETLRYAQGDTRGGGQMLRCAQHDKGSQDGTRRPLRVMLISSLAIPQPRGCSMGSHLSRVMNWTRTILKSEQIPIKIADEQYAM